MVCCRAPHSVRSSTIIIVEGFSKLDPALVAATFTQRLAPRRGCVVILMPRRVDALRALQWTLRIRSHVFRRLNRVGTGGSGQRFYFVDAGMGAVRSLVGKADSGVRAVSRGCRGWKWGERYHLGVLVERCPFVSASKSVHH